LFVVAIAYYAVAELGLRLALVGRSVTPLWPPTGLALVAFLMFGRRVWPAVTVAAFAVNLPISPNAFAAGAIAVGNTLAPMLAAVLLARVGFEAALNRVKDAFALVFLGALVSMTVSASVGSLALMWSGAIAHRNLLGTWSVWWTGDAMGVLIVAPFLLFLVVDHSHMASRRRYAEAAILAVLLVAACLAGFVSDAPLMFLVLPVLGWIAWRFEQRGSAPAALFVSVAATFAAVHEVGPFAATSLVRRMVILQSFNATVAFTAILLAAAVAQRERFAEREHRVAETLQRSLLPDQLPHVAELASASRYIPATADLEVGGDWYDIVAMPDGRFALAVGDVAGHGVVAAAVMGQLRMALRAYALDDVAPGEALRRCNRMLPDLGPNDLATAWCGYYNPRSGVLVFSNAGHPPPLIVVANPPQTSYLDDVHGPPLGALPEVVYGQTERELAPDTTVVLYTDGLIERRGSSLDVGLRALRDAALAAPPDLELLCDHLVRELVTQPTTDDIAVLAFRPMSLSDSTLHLSHDTSLPALSRTRQILASWLQQHKIPGPVIFDVLVAVTEAHTNALQHAYVDAGPVDIDGIVDGYTLDITVTDQGSWRQPVRESANAGGNGIDLMRALMDTVEIDANGTGTTVHMRRVFNHMPQESNASAEARPIR
jgi:serine phosphatase RsbU (regulator of sigma subunit)/anti-sigma regulatory factor (Ser/Thr protein kinase)